MLSYTKFKTLMFYILTIIIPFHVNPPENGPLELKHVGQAIS